MKAFEKANRLEAIDERIKKLADASAEYTAEVMSGGGAESLAKSEAVNHYPL